MNSESVDFFYLDPPFNSNRNYAAPTGNEAAGAAFKHTWMLDDVDWAWHGEIEAGRGYLTNGKAGLRRRQLHTPSM